MGIAVLQLRLAADENRQTEPNLLTIRPSTLAGVTCDAAKPPPNLYTSELCDSWTRNGWQVECVPGAWTEWTPVLLESVDIVAVGQRKVTRADSLPVERLYDFAATYYAELRQRLSGRVAHVVIERQRKKRKMEMLALGTYAYFREAGVADVVIQSALRKLEVLPCPLPMRSVLTRSTDAYVLRKCVAVEMVQFLLEHTPENEALRRRWNLLPWAVRRDPADALLHVVFHLERARQQRVLKQTRALKRKVVQRKQV